MTKTMSIVRGPSREARFTILQNLIDCAKEDRKLEVHFEGQSYSITQAEAKLARLNA